MILPDIFSSGGSKNLFIDKYGRAKKISGYLAQNASPVVSNSGGVAMMCRAILPYRATGGGTTVRQVLGVFQDGSAHADVYKSLDDGATWTFVVSLGAGSSAVVPDNAQFNDTLYYTDGVVAPKKWDGTTWGTAGRTQSPTPTAVASASVGALLGTYTYKLVSILNDGSRGAGSPSSAAVSVQNLQASLSWSADANTNVVGYEIYRTSGVGSVLYFISYVSGRLTVAYTDNNADLTILENRVLEENGDPPPLVASCEPHKQRMWWARTSAHPTRAYWSDPGLPEDVLATNYLDFSDSETVGDVITGMLGNFEGRLVVFTEKAIWTVSGTGQIIGDIADWTRIRTNAQTGSVTSRSVARVPAGAKYSDQNGKIQLTGTVTIAYMTPLGDIRLFDGDNDVVISRPMRVSLSGFNYAARAKTFCVHDGVRSEISWVFPSGANGEPSTAVVWNYRWGIWYDREWAFSHGVAMEDAITAQLILTGESSTAVGGLVYLQWTGNSFNGVPIEARWMTKVLYGVNEQAQPSLEETKRWRWVDFIFETEQTAPLTIEWFAGNAPDNAAALASMSISPTAEHLKSANGSFLTTSNGSHLIVSSLSSEVRALLKDPSTGDYLHDTGIRLRIGDNAANGSWSLEAFKIAYQSLPGLQRRMP